MRNRKFQFGKTKRKIPSIELEIENWTNYDTKDKYVMVQFIDQNALQGLTNVIHSDLILDGKQLNSRLSIAVGSSVILIGWKRY